MFIMCNNSNNKENKHMNKQAIAQDISVYYMCLQYVLLETHPMDLVDVEEIKQQAEALASCVR